MVVGIVRFAHDRIVDSSEAQYRATIMANIQAGPQVTLGGLNINEVMGWCKDVQDITTGEQKPCDPAMFTMFQSKGQPIAVTFNPGPPSQCGEFTLPARLRVREYNGTGNPPYEITRAGAKCFWSAVDFDWVLPAFFDNEYGLVWPNTFNTSTEIDQLRQADVAQSRFLQMEALATLQSVDALLNHR